MLGYQRPYGSLQEATEAVAAYHCAGHVSDENVGLHLALANQPRPSDYAALFHIHSVLPNVQSVFDVGGNVGNLFYCYSKYLKLPATLAWTVYDLPGTLARGQEIARKRDEHRLRFTEDFLDAEGADLLIASGSLHYFARLLGDWIADLRRKPKYVLINRTPLVNGRPTATVQDAGHLLAACNLFNRDELLESFYALGYEAVDTWQAEELQMQIPCYPEFSVPAYSGMFLELRGGQSLTAKELNARLVGLAVPE